MFIYVNLKKMGFVLLHGCLPSEREIGKIKTTLKYNSILVKEQHTCLWFCIMNTIDVTFKNTSVILNRSSFCG